MNPSLAYAYSFTLADPQNIMGKKPRAKPTKPLSMRQKIKMLEKHNGEMAAFTQGLLIHVAETHKRCAALELAASGIKVTSLAFRVKREMKDICVVLGPYLVDVVEMGKGGPTDAS